MPIVIPTDPRTQLIIPNRIGAVYVVEVTATAQEIETVTATVQEIETVTATVECD